MSSTPESRDPSTPKSRDSRARLEGVHHRPDGLPELTLNQMCLLLALRDFPHRRAPSRIAWMRAALPYVTRVRPNASAQKLVLTAWGMPASLVTRTASSRGVTAEATKAGRALPERYGKVWIVRHGLWMGLDALVVALDRKRRERGRKRVPVVGFVRGDLWGGPRDGSHVVLRLPARDEVTAVIPLPDGRRGLARYVQLSAESGEPVFLPADAMGPTGRPPVDTLIPMLEGKRGVRYRFTGML